MITVSIVPKGHPIANLMNVIGAKSFPSLVKSIRKSANEVLKEWVKRVDNSNAKPGWKRRYRDSINIENQTDPLSASVSAQGKSVFFIENGIRKFDMKPGLLGGPKARQGKNGPYNIIFFRKGTPKAQTIPAMPKNVYQAMREYPSSLSMRVVGIGAPISTVAGKLDPRDNKTKYSPLKARVHNKGSPQLRKQPNIPEEYTGLTRVGAVRHSQYGTFRVVSTKSKGWIYPGSPAIKIFPTLEKDLRPKIKENLQNGLMQDLKDEATRMGQAK